MLSPAKLKDRIFYGWVVVVTFFIVGITLYGIYFSFGIFFKSIASEFSLTRTETSAIASANILLAGFFAFVSGWALDRYGPKLIVLFMGIFTGLSLILTSQTTSLWQLFITYSLLLSIGTGAVYVVPMSTVSRWFNRKRGLALGLASTGVGLGMIIFAQLATHLITNYDWRTAYLVMGLIAWVAIIPLSRLLKGDPSEVGALPDGVKTRLKRMSDGGDYGRSIGFSLSQVFRSRSFWFLLYTWTIFAVATFMVYIHLVPHITDLGFSAAEAATVFSLVGVASIAGRVPVGIASDKIGRKLTVIFCIVLEAGSIFWLAWANELWALYLFVLVFGFAATGLSTSMGALVGDVFGAGKTGAIFGMLEFGLGVGAAIGTVMAGYVFDVTGNYQMAFLAGSLALITTALTIAMVRRETKGDFE